MTLEQHKHLEAARIAHFDFTSKTEKRGRPRKRTAEYWREYYTRKQREWRAAHPGWKQARKQRKKQKPPHRKA
jgi:hypothetical protein